MTAIAPPRASAPATPPGAPRRTLASPSGRVLTAAALLLGLVVAAVWSIVDLEVGLNQLERGLANAGRFLQRTVPFEWPSLGDVLWLSAMTLAIVVLGTLLATVISIPVAYLSAANTSPGGLVTRLLGRLIGIVSRATPDAFLALAFAMIIAQGALPGILALGLHSVGMISKLTADAIEQIDEGPRLALSAAGATKAQEFWGGIWPQILPSVIATVLHRADINLRATVVLGFVGVAGLGYELSLGLKSLNYREGIPYAIIMFALCIVFEIIATSVRSTLLGVRPSGRSLGGLLARRTVPAAAVAVDPLKQPWTPERRRLAGFSRSSIVVILAALAVISTSLPNFSLFWQNTGIALNRMLPPQIDEAKWGSVAEDFLITIQVGLAATLVGVILSAVFGVFAARNVAPNPTVRGVFRLLLVVNRGIPELLLAFFLIILTGLGATAGVVALAIGGIGLLGKLVADSLEEVDPGPERALRATGASRAQIFFAATLPQAAPAIVGHVLYLLDTNVRASSLLGVIGGAGIGFTILQASRINHQEMLALLIVMVFVVLAIEALSSLIRSLVK